MRADGGRCGNDAFLSLEEEEEGAAIERTGAERVKTRTIERVSGRKSSERKRKACENHRAIDANRTEMIQN